MPEPGGYLDDLPSVPPLFDFDLVGGALAEVLLQPAEGATVIGIHGPWGSGKTTLMYALRDSLLETLGEQLLIVVEFNAWKYHEREALWRALILRLVGQLRQRGIAQEKLDELEHSLYRAFEVAEPGAWTVNWRQAAIEVVSVGLEVAQLGFVGNLLRRLTGGGKDSGGIGDKDVERIAGIVERRSVSRRVEQVQSIEQFLSLFRDVITDLQSQGHKLVVLIDDLDRCLPEAALQIFEAIKLFLDAPGCGFVVAVDREVIKKGLDMRYAAGAGSASLVNPDEYIEKTIALSYDVPRLSSPDLDALISTAALPFDLDDANRQLIRIGLGSNPRRIKRFLNLLRVQAELAERVRERGGRPPDAFDPEGVAAGLGPLLKTMLIGYRYSSLLQRASEDPELLFALQQLANSTRRADTTLAAARASRDARLREIAPDLRTLADREPLWSLLSEPPDLVTHRRLVTQLADWFRQTGVPVSGDEAGPAPVT